MDIQEAYKMVLKDIKDNDMGLLLGRFDAKHGKDEFMYGIGMVMETLSEKAGPEGEKFMNAFNRNYYESMKKAGRV